MLTIQSNLVSKFDFVIHVRTTHGWVVQKIIAVTKESVLVQLLKVETLVMIDVGEKFLEFIVVGEEMEMQYTMVM